VELVDQDGKTLGRYYPDKAIDIYAEPSEEELDRIERTPQPRYTTAQVIAHLEQLGRENPS
jgi:hypothetical protein